MSHRSRAFTANRHPEPDLLVQRFLRTACVAAALVAGGAASASAQGIIPLAAEVRGGLALPQGDWNDNDALGTGFGYGFSIRMQLMPLISAYGGWDRYTFNIDGPVDADAEDTGFQLGAQVSLPLSLVTGVSPFAYAGALFNTTTTTIGDGTRTSESDRGIGYEVGAGLAFPFAPTLTITPQVRYRTHGAEFHDGAGGQDLTVSYLSFDLGLRLGI